MVSLPFPSGIANASGLSVRARVFGGFGIVLLLLAAVGAVAKISVIVISTKVGPVENAAGVLAAVSNLELRLLETGKQINAYWATEYGNEAELLKQCVDKLSAAFERFKQLPHGEEERALVNQISAQLHSYLETVGKTIQTVAGRRKAGEKSNVIGIVMTNASGALFGHIEKEGRFDLGRVVS
jgi:CHASE3 domain sensor protein